MKECPKNYQNPPEHYGPGGSALWPENLHAYDIHRSLRTIGEATWRFFDLTDDPVEREALHQKLMILAERDHPPPYDKE